VLSENAKTFGGGAAGLCPEMCRQPTMQSSQIANVLPDGSNARGLAEKTSIINAMPTVHGVVLQF